jgi:hypothetical protein
MAGTLGKVKLHVTWPIRLEIKYPNHVRYFPISWLTYVYMFARARACVCACVRARAYVCLCSRSLFV